MNQTNDDVIQAARRAWEAVTPQESLPESRTAALFNEIRREAQDTPYVPLLIRGWRWAFVGSLPVLAIAATLIVSGERSHPTLAQLTASKVNGEVVFTLANGRTDHVVYSSSDPSSFRGAEAEPLRSNSFRVDANDGPAVVFYRID